MNLQKSFVNYLITIMLLISSLSFFFFSLGRSFLSYESLHNVVINFDFIKYIKDNDILKDSLNEKKIPLEIFNYIDSSSINSIMEEHLYNFYYNGNSTIDKSSIKDIIVRSINVYENKNTIEILKFVDYDIDYFISRVEESLYDKIYFDEFITIRDFVFNNLLFYLNLLICVFCSIILITINLKNSIIVGTVSFLFSILLYLYVNYFNFNIIFNILELDIDEYFNINNISFINSGYQIFYILLFLLSMVLFSIYVLLHIKVLLRKLRSLYYNSIYK